MINKLKQFFCLHNYPMDYGMPFPESARTYCKPPRTDVPGTIVELTCRKCDYKDTFSHHYNYHVDDEHPWYQGPDEND